VVGEARSSHILVVNDTQEMLDLFQELLEEEGFRVTTSLAVLDVDKIMALAPDLIVQDLLFAHVQETGWKFLELVRLSPDLAQIPVILCTAAIDVVRDEEMAERLRRMNVHVVLKPFAIEELLEEIARALPGCNEAIAEGS
jgi:CheY-like chemotaxis protein